MSLNNVLIFGDSYSTFRGFIPEGYAEYYAPADVNPTDVRRVEQTWWHQLITRTNSQLLLNNSWSGSTICYTAYENVDCSESSSFIYRLDCLEKAGFFRDNRVDTCFLFGGTNDSWACDPIGQLQFGDWTKQDLFSVLPAICCMVSKLKAYLPQTRVICVINTELNPQIAQGMQAACDHYGVETVVLQDIDKIDGHPTILGMTQICDQIQSCL